MAGSLHAAIIGHGKHATEEQEEHRFLIGNDAVVLSVLFRVLPWLVFQCSSVAWR